jgi:DNA-binding transcriptional LysR family regulator
MGTIPTIGPFLLPRVLPGLRETYRGLKLYLVEDLTDRLIASLHRGELDVVLLALPHECGAVENVVLFKDPFVVGLPRGHPLAKEVSIKPQNLLGEDLLLLKDGHCLRDHALAALRRLADRRIAEFEATSLQTLVQMVIFTAIARGTDTLCRESYCRSRNQISAIDSTLCPKTCGHVGRTHRCPPTRVKRISHLTGATSASLVGHSIPWVDVSMVVVKSSRP